MRPIIDIIPTDPAPDVKAGIYAALISFNAEMRNFAPEEPDFAIAIRDPETKEVTGGLYGVDGYGWAFVKLLIVPEPYRGMGLGTRLIEEAEAIARARGYIGVWLDTFEFQARPFYEKLGYTLFGELEGGSGAIPRYFLKKKF
jgi:GNAT superfamily N-acetyltransferase